jgi:hypothetical protein
MTGHSSDLVLLSDLIATLSSNMNMGMDVSSTDSIRTTTPAAGSRQIVSPFLADDLKIPQL